jgi:acyl carrier protein
MSRKFPHTYLEAFNMFEQFKELLIEEFQVEEDKITLDAELSGDLAINSIELAELILRCEETFGIEIQEDEMHKFVTVGDVVEYLNTLEK